LNSNEQFIKHSTHFKNLCNNFIKEHGYFDPLYSLDHDSEFNNYVISKLKLTSFEEYRDVFYDKFGIDLVEYYEKIIDTKHNAIKQEQSYKVSILKHVSMNYYPYKSNSIIHNINITKPVHKFIKLYSSYIEISPFLGASENIDILKYNLKNLKNNLKDISNIFDLFYEHESDNKEDISNALPGIKQGQDILKKSFILVEIIKSHNLKDDIEKAIRLYNFYILKKYNMHICIEEDNLSDMLNDINGISTIYGTLKLNHKATVTLITDGNSRTDIKKFTKILLQNLI